MKLPASIIAALALLAGVALPAAETPMVTRWAAEVDPARVLPEYPRPQLVREQWLNLNGLWDYSLTRDTTAPGAFTNRILVPFPLESHLSRAGVPLEEGALWYRRSFTVPQSWRGQNVKLHFGAVDWAARVWLNGRFLGGHRGGYDSFSFELSSALKWQGENELLVMVQDPTEGNQPRGKQTRKPEGAFYQPSSGIWQTVWLEPVPAWHIQSLSLVPDLARSAVRVTAQISGPSQADEVRVIASFNGQVTGRAAGKPGADMDVLLSQAHPWSPESPALYDLEVELMRSGAVVDRVRSYFGLREIRLGTDATGRNRLFLNGQPLFQMGVLDQGYWPDGLYTAPTDDALRFDILTAKRLGFNLLRKHVKVEPERWYYWADRLGMLVWQDMPSGNNTTEAARRQFEMELHRMIEQKGNHPSIVMWVLFNEGWGQFETERLARRIKAADPSRLVNNASGWTDMKSGDVIDYHSYPEPAAPPAEVMRAGVLGEFGGFHLVVSGHQWSRSMWGYARTTDSQHLIQEYSGLLERVWELKNQKGLAAAVYTQLTDVETEGNGFLTYDRQVLKVNPSEIRQANLRQTAAEPYPMLLGDARHGEFQWACTTNTPAEDWMVPGFDDSAWKRGLGGFGSRGTPGTVIRTEWTSSDIWLRREFELPENFEMPSALTLSHDEQAEVYLNGVLITRAPSYTIGYHEIYLGANARSALRPGRNVLAVHCHQTGGGQYIDAGLTRNLGAE